MRYVLILSLLLIAAYNVQAQRSQIIQLKTGFYTNFGVAFHDYYDADSTRHNFEWDQHFNSQYIGVGWRFPINVYLEAGFSYNHSITAKTELIEAESFLYGQDNVPTAGVLYAGTSVLKSRYQEFLMDIRINHLIRSQKVQVYLVFNYGLILVQNSQDASNSYEASNEDLQKNIESTYISRDHRGSYGFGFGLDYQFGNGIKINLIDFKGTVIKDWEESKLLISKYGIAVSAGVSYQFRRAR